MKNEQQSQNLLLKVDPRSTFHKRDKLTTPGENWGETTIKICNETMLRDKLRFF